jgi:hypothetical protein
MIIIICSNFIFASYHKTSFCLLGFTKPGYGVQGIARDEAVTLGREFRQEAIFWVEKGIVFLVSCADATNERIGSWSVMVLPD